MLQKCMKEIDRGRERRAAPYELRAVSAHHSRDSLSAALAHLKCPSILQPSINKRTTWVLGSICTVSWLGGLNPTQPQPNPTHLIPAGISYPLRLHHPSHRSLQYLYRFWVSPAIQMPFISPLRAHTHTYMNSHTHGHICVDRELRSDFALTLARFNAFSARSEDNSRATCGFFKVCFYPQLPVMEVEQEG